jgi:hypothetical protein
MTELTPADLERVGQQFILITMTRGHGCDAWENLCGEWAYGHRWLLMKIRSCSEITQGRSEAMSEWLTQTGKPWAIWLDDDMQISWSDLMAFCLTALDQAEHLDTLSGVATTKAKASGKICVEPVADELAFGEAGDVVAVKRHGFALLCVKRALCQRIAQQLPVVRYTNGRPGWPFCASLILKQPDDPECPARHLSEDHSFCVRALAVGGRLFADTRFRLGHEGPYVYYPEDALSEVELQPTLRFKVR